MSENKTTTEDLQKRLDALEAKVDVLDKVLASLLPPGSRIVNDVIYVPYNAR